MHEMWNFVLIKNNLLLIMKPGMFICMTCKGQISKTNPCFPTIDLPRLLGYILIYGKPYFIDMYSFLLLY